MTPATWLEELGQELAARGFDAAAVASTVVELQVHLHESGGTPLATFGPPSSYAEEMARSVQPVYDLPRSDGPIRVSAAGVAKSYQGRPVLHYPGLQVRAGEIVLLFGPNGSGKSTLLRILGGLVTPDRGAVRVTGSVGYVPQSGGLYERLRPSEHFVLFGRGRGLSRRASSREGRRLAEQLGWDAPAAPVVSELSGGTRQKLNVVLAGLGDPDILLMDEPTQGLDLDSTRRFWELAWAWREAGRALLVVAHTREAFARVDAVVELAAASERRIG